MYRLGLFRNAFLFLILACLLGNVFSHSHSHSHSHGHSHSDISLEKNPNSKERSASDFTLDRSELEIWIRAIICTCFVCCAPIPILYIIPLGNSKKNENKLLKILLSFAVGGLLGDVFLHLLPHSTPFTNDEEQNHRNGMIVGLWVLIGFILFLAIEKIVRIFDKASHSSSRRKENKSEKNRDGVALVESKIVRQRSNGGSIDRQTNRNAIDNETSSSTGHIHTAAWLNLAADFTHNFTDGLAIGGSFLVGNQVGLITTIAVFMHEIPHEIGDFAILVQSGFSKNGAMKAQFSTAIGAMIGTLLGLLSHSFISKSTLWVLPFTAGGFIYISTVTVIPSLLEESNFVQSLKEITALCIGVGLMALLVYME